MLPPYLLTLAPTPAPPVCSCCKQDPLTSLECKKGREGSTWHELFRHKGSCNPRRGCMWDDRTGCEGETDFTCGTYANEECEPGADTAGFIVGVILITLLIVACLCYGFITASFREVAVDEETHHEHSRFQALADCMTCYGLSVYTSGGVNFVIGVVKLVSMAISFYFTIEALNEVFLASDDLTAARKAQFIASSDDCCSKVVSMEATVQW